MVQLYQLTNGTSVLRTSDNVGIPADPMNKDFQEYSLWLESGNIPDPYVPEIVIKSSEDKISKLMELLITKGILDAKDAEGILSQESSINTI